MAASPTVIKTAWTTLRNASNVLVSSFITVNAARMSGSCEDTLAANWSDLPLRYPEMPIWWLHHLWDLPVDAKQLWQFLHIVLFHIEKHCTSIATSHAWQTFCRSNLFATERIADMLTTYSLPTRSRNILPPLAANYTAEMPAVNTARDAVDKSPWTKPDDKMLEILVAAQTTPQDAHRQRAFFGLRAPPSITSSQQAGNHYGSQ